MTLTLFIILFAIFAVVVSLITEAVKNLFDKLEAKYSSNVVVLVVSTVVGAGGTAIVYIFMGIPFILTNILCMPLMALAVWVGAMVGYDKVMQMIEQIKTIRIK